MKTLIIFVFWFLVCMVLQLFIYIIPFSDSALDQMTVDERFTFVFLTYPLCLFPILFATLAAAGITYIEVKHVRFNP